MPPHGHLFKKILEAPLVARGTSTSFSSKLHSTRGSVLSRDLLLKDGKSRERLASVGPLLKVCFMAVTKTAVNTLGD